MKKIFIFIVIIIVLFLGYWMVHKRLKQNDPIPVPESPIVERETPITKETIDESGQLIVTSPSPNQVLEASPIVVKGRARGNWFFEATAPVTITNWDGLIIGQGYISVDQPYDWMTTDFVPFTGTITYDKTQLGAYNHGYIIFKNSNASGEPQFDKSLEFKILFP